MRRIVVGMMTKTTTPSRQPTITIEINRIDYLNRRLEGVLKVPRHERLRIRLAHVLSWEWPEHLRHEIGPTPDTYFIFPSEEEICVLDLGARGAPVARTRLAPATPSGVAEALGALGLGEAVLKPVIGASGFGVERVRRGEEEAALARARAGKAMDEVLVQEFVAGIERGELAGVFFDGAFSHGLRRRPAPGEFRINSQYGGRMEAATLPEAIVVR